MKGISDCTNILIFCTVQGKESQWRFRKTVHVCECAHLRICMYACASVQVCACVCICYKCITAVHAPIMWQCLRANTCTCLPGCRKGINLSVWRLWSGSQHSAGPLFSSSLCSLIWDAGMVTVFPGQSVRESAGEEGPWRPEGWAPGLRTGISQPRPAATRCADDTQLTGGRLGATCRPHTFHHPVPEVDRCTYVSQG